MIKGEISALKGSEQTMSSDIATLASRVDAKLAELQATTGDLRTALTSAGPAPPPGIAFGQEMEEIKCRLTAHWFISHVATRTGLSLTLPRDSRKFMLI